MNTRSRWLFAVVVSLVALAAWSAGASAGRVPAAEGAASMSYTFDPDAMYRMPTHFGPRTGPRRGPNGETFDNVGAPQKKTIAVSFLTNAEQLAALLPEGFSLNGEPVVTVAATYITEIPWLAGRGYNILGVSFPARFEGREDRASGSILLVLWENLTDPILTGRDELGFSKIYADLPEPRVYEGETHVTASWMGFKFLDMSVKELQEVPVADGGSTAADRTDGELSGTLHYKYIPKTGEWGTADVHYAVLSPSGNTNEVPKGAWRGEGTLQFHRARWEDMPTQYNIVNALADLEIKEFRGARISTAVGGKDLSDQRILR